MSADTPVVLTEQEREALGDSLKATRNNQYGRLVRLVAVAEGIVAARVAAERERADTAEAKIAAVRAALTSDDLAARVVQMMSKAYLPYQRQAVTTAICTYVQEAVRAALGGEATP